MTPSKSCSSGSPSASGDIQAFSGVIGSRVCAGRNGDGSLSAQAPVFQRNAGRPMASQYLQLATQKVLHSR